MKGIEFHDILFTIKDINGKDNTIVKCDGEYLPATSDTYLIQGDPDEVSITRWKQINTPNMSKVVDFDEFFEAFYEEFLDQAYYLVYKPYLDSYPEPEHDDSNWSEGLEQDEFLG